MKGFSLGREWIGVGGHRGVCVAGGGGGGVVTDVKPL